MKQTNIPTFPSLFVQDARAGDEMKKFIRLPAGLGNDVADRIRTYSPLPSRSKLSNSTR